MPPFLKNTLGWTFVAVAWTSLISFFWQLTVVVDAVQWLYERSGYAAPALLFIGKLVHAIVGVWREVTEPIRLAISYFLSFDLPRAVFDVIFLLTVFIGTYLKAWLATREERKVMAVFSGVKVPLFRISNFSPEGVLSYEGKLALLSRMIAALDILDQHYSSYIQDKAEGELVSALDEMTDGVSDDDFLVLERAFSLPKDEMIEFLRDCAVADQVTAWRSRRIVRRGVVTSAVIAGSLIIDFAYNRLM